MNLWIGSWRRAARVDLQSSNEKFNVTLSEPACPASKATIFNVPEGEVVIRLDENISLNNIFQGTFEERKQCDFVIVAERGNSVVVVYIEMKLTHGDNADIRNQLRGGRCFVNYVQIIGESIL